MLYEDNTEKEVCGYEISGFDNMKVEPQTVTVIYKGYDNLCYNYKKLRGESMKVNYNSTIRSCFIGYIVQAIVNNFVPLLFITFQSQYSIPLSKITLLITINFGLQLIIDFASAFFIDKIGYRLSVLIAHLFAALGLISIAILPDMMNDSFDKDHNHVMVSVNTDDPGVFGTTLKNQYGFILQVLIDKGVPMEKALKWIDMTRENGLNSTFINRTKKTKKEIEEELKEIKRILEEKLNRRDDNK